MNRRVPNGTHGGVEGGLITRPSDCQKYNEMEYTDIPKTVDMICNRRYNMGVNSVHNLYRYTS